MRAVAIAAVAVASLLPMRAGAADVSLDVRAGSLRDALVAIGNRAGVTIGFTDPSLGSIRVPALQGRLSVAHALSRLLAGTAATFVRVDASTFLIKRRSAGQRPAMKMPVPSRDRSEILVTGSKIGADPGNYAGSVMTIQTSTLPPGRLIHGSEALVAEIPTLSSTHLGPGRNKLFIRGIADSSFNGPTQATVGQYLGDVRLNYAAPDPDLALYDIRSVEVLEGPQGTLYGAGSLGGVIRLEPTPPDLSAASLDMVAGGATTAHGAPGGDAAGIANLPLVSGRVGLRVVAYGSVDGGYIDDPLRGRSDINQTATRGGRATLRVRPAADWTIDLGGVVQNINSVDGQYATRGLPPLERESEIAQPFDNDYALADLVVHHDMDGIALIWATSAVFHDVASTYDASPSPAEPTRYHEDHDISLVTNETRLSQQASNGSGWIAGVEFLRSSDRLHRRLGPPGAEDILSGTGNTVEQGSLYGEATIALTARFLATGGGRLSITRLVAHVIDQPTQDTSEHRRKASLLPAAGIVWKIRPNLSLYARYQEGDRPGGLAAQSSGTRRFESDSVASWEAGLRYGTGLSPFSITVAGSYAHWEDIQADLVASDGLPYTANIGSGRILGIELRSSWRPISGLTLEGDLFAGDSNLGKPAPAFAGEKDATLPNIADLTGRMAARYAFIAAGHSVDLSGSVNYVGGSRLGVGPALDLPQGRYFETALGASVTIGHATISLDATNLLDTSGNIFALGDPFGVMSGTQTTPLRPRSVRLGLGMAF